MEIKFIDGDLMTSCDNVIAHQTNCHGIMGSGVAKQIKETFPAVFDEYRIRCYSQRTIGNALGECQLVETANGMYVANIFGQCDYGNDGKRYTDYAALKSAFISLRKQMRELNLHTLSLPYLMGCGLGGGNWDSVLHIINDVFKDTDVVITIYKFKKP